MAAPASPSSDDPETLKALLAEERAENERLRQIIRVRPVKGIRPAKDAGATG